MMQRNSVASALAHGTQRKMSGSDEYSRRRGRDHRCDDTAASKRPRRSQKHLYLVMDDWEMGYSIHKLDVDELASDDDKELRRLPEPCALRIEAPEERCPAVLTSLGSKIFFLTDRFSDDAPPFLIYDTATASLAMGPRPTLALRPLGFMFIVPVDQRLYAFNPRRADLQCSFEVVSRAAPRDEEDDEFRRLSRRRAEAERRWSVESVPAPMPLGKHENVTAYAVDPHGRAIFVSARNWSRLRGERTECTLSFDARASAWTLHGEWQMPFQGQGHFADELDAWVGLRRDGFLCSCDVPSRGGAAALPDFKMGKETLFREDAERHIGQPTLTYMGDSRFCMVECAARRGIRMVDAEELRFTVHVRTLCLGMAPCLHRKRSGCKCYTKVTRDDEKHIDGPVNHWALPRRRDCFENH